MKIIEPKAELWSEEGISAESHIARCARVCYGHEDREPNKEADEKLVKGLIKRGHLSMLRHASYYRCLGNIDDLGSLWSSEFVKSLGIYSDRDYNVYVSTNRQFTLENNIADRGYTPADYLELCRKNSSFFIIYRLTFCITTQISTSRELNRVSPNNIAERSTRYNSSKDGLVICRPWWFKSAIRDVVNGNCPLSELWYYDAMERSEGVYKALLDKGMKPEDARGIIPLDTATKVIYTYSVKEWKHILDLRYYGKTGTPHPNAKLIMGMVRDQINDFARQHNIDYQV